MIPHKNTGFLLYITLLNDEIFVKESILSCSLLFVIVVVVVLIFFLSWS